MKNLLFLILILSFNSYSQFDSLIFTKGMRLNYTVKSIYPLGDQNLDGFDDIMLYDCNEKKGYIYFGGNPMDTIPVNSIQFFDSIYVSGSIDIIDINNDNVNDIVVTSVLLSDSGYYSLGPIRIYYGGDLINNFPDLTFNPPQGAKGIVPQVLKDFNGDGKSELVLYDPNLPYSNKQFGTFYFYNTASQFDTIPQYIIMGDSINFIRYWGGINSSGDLNGDNKTDFTIYATIGEEPPYDRHFRSFYLGNESFNLEPAVTYYKDEHSFAVEHMKIINDINGDGKDDILTKDYGFYPAYYYNTILYGGFPIDTIPDVGLNTQNEGLNLQQTFSLGDVNGDGYNDFFSHTHIFGYPNIKLWVGGRNMPYTISGQANKTWLGASDGFGRILSNIGDVDGDSINDIAIGQILYGAQPTEECNNGWVYIYKGDTSVMGDTGTVDISDYGIVPKGYYLYDPYPNPFNQTNVVSYQIPSVRKVIITVLDILGKEIVKLVNEERNKGKHIKEFDAAKYNLSSGIYLIKLDVYSNKRLEFSASKKITLLK